jgi:hypothetical protein
MPRNDYHFVTDWRVEGTVDEVSAVLGDPVALPRWWPSVYLEVTDLEPGRADDVGREATLHTRGWLPYTLRWILRVTESNRPHGFAFDARGDFEGKGVWTFTQDGRWVDVRFDWRIRAQKPLLRLLSPLLRPAFAANHRWAMARGEESLRAELARRRADGA